MFKVINGDTRRMCEIYSKLAIAVNTFIPNHVYLSPNTERSPLPLQMQLSRRPNPVDNYIFKVNVRNARTRCEICSKLTIKTPERRHFWKPFGNECVNYLGENSFLVCLTESWIQLCVKCSENILEAALQINFENLGTSELGAYPQTITFWVTYLFYNTGHNILANYCVPVKFRCTASKTGLDVRKR